MGEIEWARMRAFEIRALAERETVVIVPIGSLEQHGPHLPTATDSLLVSEVAHRAARLASEEMPIIVTPCVWTGLSEHHVGFNGTVTLDFAAFAAVLRGIVDSLVRSGFERICLLNGHGGNAAALRTVTDELTFEYELPIVSGTYWQIAAGALNAVLEKQRSITHACEAETSMIMALAPSLVDEARLGEADAGGQMPDPASEDGLYRWRSFTEKTSSGARGVPSAATPEKGERLLKAAAEALAARLSDERLWARSEELA